MQMEEQLKQLIEKAKTDKKVLECLKYLAVETKLYEFAATIQAIEKEHYPETEERIKAKKIANEIAVGMGLLDMKADPRTAYLMYELVVLYQKHKGKMDLEKIIELKYKVQNLF